MSSSKSVNGMWVSGLINTSWEDVCEEFDHPTKGSAFKETLGPLTKDGHCPFQKVKSIIQSSNKGMQIENSISCAGHPRVWRTEVRIDFSNDGENTAQSHWQMASQSAISKGWTRSDVQLLLFHLYSHLIRPSALRPCNQNGEIQFNKIN